MRITVLAGGIGGARFLRGLLAELAVRLPDENASSGTSAEVTVIGNTGDDLWIYGLRVCPDLDTVMYTLGDGISAERGWGREDETFRLKDELIAYGAQPQWFGLGDLDMATHILRTQALNSGYTLTSITQRLCERWQPGVTLIPMSDDRVETHVLVDDPDTGTRSAIHFQEWWVRHHAALPAHEFVQVGVETAQPAPGVLDALRNADVVLLPPSNPVVSVGTILGVPGIRQALRTTPAPVVGVSPIVGGAPVRGMADACLSAIGVETSAVAVARHYGPRRNREGGDGGGLLDGWLVDDVDAAGTAALSESGIATIARPLLMTDMAATQAIAAAALDLAETVRR
jgi:LPPG:FO 2-phospho-L-lactate transferase